MAMHYSLFIEQQLRIVVDFNALKCRAAVIQLKAEWAETSIY